jgi:phosphoglycolate phosphatase
MYNNRTPDFIPPEAAVPQPLRAVLFDLDGTLIDSFPAITASVNHVRAGHGLPPLSEPEVRRHVGRGAAHLLTKTVLGGDLRADIAAYKAHHPSVLREGTRLLPGAAEALRALHQRGLKLGVCSNKPVAFTRDLAAILGVADCLDLLLGPEDVVRPKPAPDMLLTALQRLRLAPAVVLYVGDMVVDIEAARAAGVRVWVVATGSEEAATLDRAGPDRRLRDLFELRDLLAGQGTEALGGPVCP